MKFEIVPNHELNFDSWDLLIANSEQGNFYALSWYLNIVAPGWFAIVGVKDAHYQIGIPLPVSKKFGFEILRQPLFCQQLGIYSVIKLTEEHVVRINNLIKSRFRYIPAYAFNYHNYGLQKYPGFGVRKNIVLKLNRPYKEIYLNYRRDRKYRLSKLRNAEIAIQKSNSIEELIWMFRENVEKKIYGGVSPVAYEMLRSIFLETSRKNMGNLIYATIPRGDIIAGGLFINFRSRITYLFNAADSLYLNLNGRTLILDSVIQEHQGKNMTLDFESPELESIKSFYLSFGAEEEIYPVLIQNKLPVWLRMIQTIRKKWAGYLN